MSAALGTTCICEEDDWELKQCTRQEYVCFKALICESYLRASSDSLPLCVTFGRSSAAALGNPPSVCHTLMLFTEDGYLPIKHTYKSTALHSVSYYSI